MEVHDPERYRALSTAAGFNLPVFKHSLINTFRSWTVWLFLSPIYNYVKEIWRWLSLGRPYSFRKQFIVLGFSRAIALRAGFQNQTHCSSLTLGYSKVHSSMFLSISHWAKKRHTTVKYRGTFLLRPLQFFNKYTPCRRKERAETHSYRRH